MASQPEGEQWNHEGGQLSEAPTQITARRPLELPCRLGCALVAQRLHGLYVPVTAATQEDLCGKGCWAERFVIAVSGNCHATWPDLVLKMGCVVQVLAWPPEMVCFSNSVSPYLGCRPRGHVGVAFVLHHAILFLGLGSSHETGPGHV